MNKKEIVKSFKEHGVNARFVDNCFIEFDNKLYWIDIESEYFAYATKKGIVKSYYLVDIEFEENCFVLTIKEKGYNTNRKISMFYDILN